MAVAHSPTEVSVSYYGVQVRRRWSIATTAAARLQVLAELPRLRRIDPLSHELVLSNGGKVGVVLHTEANQRGPDLIGELVAHA